MWLALTAQDGRREFGDQLLRPSATGGDLGFYADVRFDRNGAALAMILCACSDTDTDWTIDTFDPKFQVFALPMANDRA